MTSFVEVYQTPGFNGYLEIAKSLSNDEKFISKSQTLIETNKKLEFLEMCLTNCLGVFNKESEAISFFLVLTTMLSPEDRESGIQKVVSLLTSSEENASVKANILIHLFNTHNNSHVLEELVKFAIKTKQTNKIPKYLNNQVQIVSKISSPTCFDFALETTNLEIASLLTILKNRMIVEPSKEILNKYHIPYDTFMNKLKLLHLTQYETLTFEEVKKHIQVENVEKFVLMGIAGGLHFKVDQVTQTVHCPKNKDLNTNIQSLKEAVKVYCK